MCNSNLLSSRYFVLIGTAITYYIVVAIAGNVQESINEDYWDWTRFQLSNAIDEFRSHCEIRGKSLPAVQRAEVDALEGCVRPEFEKLMKRCESIQAEEKSEVRDAIIDLNDGYSLKPDQIDLVTNMVAAPICEFVSAQMRCIKPHLITTRELCSPDTVEVSSKLIEYVEIMFKTLCRYKGRRVVEFLAAGGRDCTDTIVGHALKCVDNSKILLENKQVYTTPELCSALGAINNCLTSSLSSCARKRPSDISRSVLEDVRPWFSTSCLISTTIRNSANLVTVVTVASVYYVVSNVFLM